jgi:hypothetical protein
VRLRSLPRPEAERRPAPRLSPRPRSLPPRRDVPDDPLFCAEEDRVEADDAVPPR